MQIQCDLWSVVDYALPLDTLFGQPLTNSAQAILIGQRTWLPRGMTLMPKILCNPWYCTHDGIGIRKKLDG